MFLAKVRGTVVSTSKDERLVGFKLLVVERLGIDGGYVGLPQVAVDTVGAGVGETVIVTGGSSARFAATRRTRRSTRPSSGSSTPWRSGRSKHAERLHAHRRRRA
jgi:microcompartment protein CcmK/EutM